APRTREAKRVGVLLPPPGARGRVAAPAREV
ncbi:MAG: hypothetical protein AVDCRST_MAG37-2022, partial [uncultured Rubrobacteraceae bacterium]